MASIQSTAARIEQVTAQTVALFQSGIESGTIPEAAAEKVNHLLNCFEQYRQAVNERLADSAGDVEPGTMPAQVITFLPPPPPPSTGVNEVVILPNSSLPVLELKSGNFINISHVAWLDVASKTVILAGGVMRSLDDADLSRIRYYLRHNLINELNK